MSSNIQSTKTLSKFSIFQKNKTHVFHEFLLKKFLAHLTKKGKRVKAEKLLKRVFLGLFLKRFSPISTLILAINNVKPFIEVRSVRIRGKSFQIPFPIKLPRQISLSIKTIIKSSTTGRNFENKLIEELINSSLGKSVSIKSTVNLHKFAFQNRLSTNYRWF